MVKRSNKKYTKIRSGRLREWRTKVVRSLEAFRRRRPHRSFKLTYRRDYARSLRLPGYWAFTAYVIRTIRSHKRLYGGMIAFYGVFSVIFLGFGSQEAYSQLSELLDETGGQILTGGWGSVGQAGLVLLSGITGSLNPDLTDAQQVYAGLIFLLTWLTTVWLLRSALAGKPVRLRDGIYNSGAPIVPTALVLVVLFMQLIPAALGIIGFNSAVSAGMFDQGFVAMLVSIVVGLLVVLSTYWIVSTFIALIIVTLPGVYPLQAVRSAGDIVIGRRIRLLLRIAWLIAINIILWVVLMLPLVILARLLAGIAPITSSLPIVPIAMTIVGSMIVVWSATYIYLLYRKVVEDDAQPA